MESFTTCFLTYYILTNRLEPVTCIGLEKLWIVKYNLQNKDLNVHVGILVLELFQEITSKIWYLLFIFTPLFSKQFYHFLNRSFNIFHAMMLIDIIQFKSALVVRYKSLVSTLCFFSSHCFICLIDDFLFRVTGFIIRQ